MCNCPPYLQQMIVGAGLTDEDDVFDDIFFADFKVGKKDGGGGRGAGGQYLFN